MSTPEEVHVIGSGGHAKVVIRSLELLGYRVVAVFDDDPDRWGQHLMEIPIVGPVAQIEEYPPLPAVIALGDNAMRRLFAEKYDRQWLTVIDPRALVDRSVHLGEGTVILPGAIVQVDSWLGGHTIVNTAASVDHDCVIGDYAHIAPGVHLAGGVSVGEGSLLGINSTTTPGIRIGSWTTVGAGAAVVRDLPSNVVAKGVPARVTRADAAPDRVSRDARPTGAPSRVYLSPPHMSGRERQLLLDAFDSNWIAPLGPHVDALEREFAEKLGVAEAVAVSSGTAALHLALLVLGVGRGDEVITSTLTFAATANAISYVGARPVFIDSDRRTWNMDPALLAEELDACVRRGQPPKAVLVADLYGQCADYAPILEACRRHDIPMIEDAAEALGATYRGKPAGRFGAVGCFSFNGNKIVTTGGGGMLVSDDRELCRRARFLATQARDPAPHYEHSEIGYNYRMNNLLAAVGRGQLQVLQTRVRQRRANYAFYRRALGDLPGIDFTAEHPEGHSTRWLTCVTVDPEAFGASRDDVLQALAAEDIESRPVWKPMHLQPVFSGCRSRGGAVAEDLFRRGLCLPSGSSLTDADRQRIVKVIRSVGKGARLPRRIDRAA